MSRNAPFRRSSPHSICRPTCRNSGLIQRCNTNPRSGRSRSISAKLRRVVASLQHPGNLHGLIMGATLQRCDIHMSRDPEVGTCAYSDTAMVLNFRSGEPQFRVKQALIESDLRPRGRRFVRISWCTRAAKSSCLALLPLALGDPGRPHSPEFGCHRLADLIRYRN
jgi:hypothetical protein